MKAGFERRGEGTMATPAGRLLDVASVAERLGVSTRTVRRLIARRELGICRIGGLVRIPEGELDRYIAACFDPAFAASTVRRPEGGNVLEVIDRILPRKRQGRGRARM